MNLVTTRVFNASPAEIWDIIYDPGNMPLYNPKCTDSDSLKTHTPGEEFEIRYQMSGRATQVTGELVAYEKERMIHFRYSDDKMGTTEECFVIEPLNDNETRLTHTVDMSRTTLPLWLKVLGSFIHRFGWSRGNGPMDGIADLLKKP